MIRSRWSNYNCYLRPNQPIYDAHTSYLISLITRCLVYDLRESAHAIRWEGGRKTKPCAPYIFKNNSIHCCVQSWGWVKNLNDPLDATWFSLFRILLDTKYVFLRKERSRFQILFCLFIESTKKFQFCTKIVSICSRPVVGYSSHSQCAPNNVNV